MRTYGLHSGIGHQSGVVFTSPMPQLIDCVSSPPQTPGGASVPSQVSFWARSSQKFGNVQQIWDQTEAQFAAISAASAVSSKNIYLPFNVVCCYELYTFITKLPKFNNVHKSKRLLMFWSNRIRYSYFPPMGVTPLHFPLLLPLPSLFKCYWSYWA
jgi:hypothetical protein